VKEAEQDLEQNLGFFVDAPQFLQKFDKGTFLRISEAL
jgi:hypothetical protein